VLDVNTFAGGLINHEGKCGSYCPSGYIQENVGEVGNPGMEGMLMTLVHRGHDDARSQSQKNRFL
jgi:hypothetical protein